MALHHRILKGIYYPLKLAKAIGKPLGLNSPHRLRVVVYHDIAPHEQSGFSEHVRWLARRWSFVTPERFSAMVSGREPILGSNLLITFDDGFVSNRVVAETVLSPMGIKALFFVVSDFVRIEDTFELRNFLARHIFPGTKADVHPAHLRNMRWDDLAYLLEQGHTIGAHTRTHARMSELHKRREIESEIIGSADAIEDELGIKVDHFAFAFGNLASLSPEALSVARTRFQFIYSNMRGNNSPSVHPWSLRRDTIDPVWSKMLVGSLLEGGGDLRYTRDLARLDSWKPGPW
jgi:peptidoglycan/xylan/chitin deacetylase (PgdA/CDA1 family)